MIQAKAIAKPSRTRPLAAAVCLGLAGLAGVAGGCRDFEAHRAQLESMYAAGQFDQAAAVLDDPKVHELYGAKSELLWKLDRGAVARALADDQKAIALLNDAEAQIESQRKNGGDVLTQWLLSDAFARYFPEPYEDMYVNVIKLLAQLEAGRLQGGATVEARRAASKADLLRDTYLKYEDAIRREGTGRVPARAGSVVATNNAGQFIESPLATFLTAVTFMKSGDSEMQRVAGKRLVDSIQLQRSLIGPVREEDFAGLDELDPRSVNVLVVAFSGRGPTKYAQPVGPIPLGTVPVYFELPYLHVFPSGVASARVEVEGGSVPQALDRLKLVEDLGQVATVNHERALPQIYARTLLRYILKAGTSVAVTEGGRRRAHEHDQGLVQLAGVLGGLAFLGLTEKADVRAWVFLPGQARVGLLNLDPGEHRIRIVYESAGGGSVYASPWHAIHVTPDGLATVVTQYWR
jgi:hypothetical protein